MTKNKKDLNQNNREFDMTKLKRTIDKSFEKRINVIEKLLKEHNVEIINANTLLGQHIISFNEVLKELRSDSEYTQKEFKGMSEKLDKVLNIKVNGFVGLDAVLKALCDVTAPQRANKGVINSIKNWFNTHKTIKTVLQSRPVVVVVTILVTLQGLKLFGVEVTKINIVEIIKNIF